MNEPSSRPFNIALIGLGALLGLALILAIGNIVSHATHKTSTTPVTSTVTSVTATSPSSITFTATIRSGVGHTATVSCVNAIVLPATPLAYQQVLTEILGPFEQRTLTVSRTLLKPKAAEVGTQSVAFKCT